LRAHLLLGQTGAFGECSTRTNAAQVKKILAELVDQHACRVVAVYIVPGLHFKDKSLLTPCVTSLVLGILNAFIRPIMDFLALPLLI